MQRPVSFRLIGGLDLVTPAVSIKPGMAIGASNYEPDIAGYRRFQGYERFDGRPRPSEGTYHMLTFTAGALSVAGGETILGVTSGAIAVALDEETLTSGTAGAGTAAGSVPVAITSGTFTAGEPLTISGAAFATLGVVPQSRAATDDASDRRWVAVDIARRRTNIQSVPGSGPIRGVVIYKGRVLAVRDNEAGTAGGLWRSTPSGWAPQTLGARVLFGTGTAAFTEGETLTQGGATATIQRVVLQSGSFSGGDAAGYLSLTGLVGAFVAGVATSAAGSATLTGGSVANVLPAGGRYEFAVHNFYGAAGDDRLYGVNGVGRAFEWDGEVFTYIRTGLGDAKDIPTNVVVFKKHLFLGYAAGSWQHSGTGEPLDFRAIVGAGEIAVGSRVTGSVLAASVVVLMSKDRIDYLAGDDAATWSLEPVTGTSGAALWSGQMMNRPIYYGDGAIRSMTPADALGGWTLSPLSEQVEPLFRALERRGVAPVASMRVRARDLYRLFFDDGSGFSVYLGRDMAEIMPLDLPNPPVCAWVSPDGPGGREMQVFGAENGVVYEMDSGDTFDGSFVEAVARLAFFSAGDNRLRKRWHEAHIELDIGDKATLFAAADFDYAHPDQPPTPPTGFTVRGGGGFYNADQWNAFNWSAQTVGEASARLDGVGRNISVVIRTGRAWDGVDPWLIADTYWRIDAAFWVESETWRLFDANEPPHVLSVLTLYATTRGLVRGNV